jgi:hypothetical protein
MANGDILRARGTGTGKELIARAIHKRSSRADAGIRRLTPTCAARANYLPPLLFSAACLANPGPRLQRHPRWRVLTCQPNSSNVPSVGSEPYLRSGAVFNPGLSIREHFARMKPFKCGLREGR